MRIAVVCSSNMNRSMEAHYVLGLAIRIATCSQYKRLGFSHGRVEYIVSDGVAVVDHTEAFSDEKLKKGFDVKSFGTGTQVKLPGKAADCPNIYPFNVSYEEIYEDLRKKDLSHYTQNGILNMVDRNRRIKQRPERFQDCTEQFDLVVTVEERVYDQVVEFMDDQSSGSCQAVHIINMDVQDNHDDATIGAFLLCQLCEELAKADDLDDAIEMVVAEFEEKHGKTLLHSIAFY